MSTTSIAITGMRTANDIIIQTSNNIANSETPGFKAGLMDLANVEGNNGVRGIEGNSIDVKGSFENTGIVTDLATSSNKGFFIVSNKLSGDVVNVATGSFRPNVNGQLEYLGKYLLLGAKYNTDGSLPALEVETLQPIVIDTNQLSKPIASTSITEYFNVNSGLLAKGQASFVMAPDPSILTTTGGKLDDFLVPNATANLQNGNGFSIQVQSEQNGQIVSESIKCVFSGAITNTLSSTGSTVSGSVTAGSSTINVTFNGVTTAIDLSAVSSMNDGDALTTIASSLNSLGLDAKVTTDASTSNTTISLGAPSNSLLEINGNSAIMQAIFAQQSISITPVSQGTVRFASMRDLKDQLHKYFKEINYNSSSQSLLFIAKPNTNVSMENLQSADILGDLGMYNGSVLGQGYDPYDTSSNMATGSTIPDILQGVALYDSKGGQHLFNIAMKKVEDGWIQEFYAANKTEIKDIRDDGLLQVTKFKFDTKGNLSSTSTVVSNLTSNISFSDPFNNLAAGTVVIDGTTFTQGTDFNSLIDLVTVINSDKTLQNNLEATIVQDTQGQFKLKLISKDNQTHVIDAPALGLNQNTTSTFLPSASDDLTINFDTAANVDPITVSFDYTQLNESVHKEMFGSVTADGMAPSTLSSISIDVDGILVGTFANGSNVNLYKIPLATYANVTGLDVIGDNALRASASSGTMRVVSAGEASSGEVLSGNIEQSNIEQAEQLTRLITNKQFYNMNTKSWQTGNAIIDYLLNATN